MNDIGEKTQDNRFVLHTCSKCGLDQVFVYWYNERKITPVGKICTCNAPWNIRNHDMSLQQWLYRQDIARINLQLEYTAMAMKNGLHPEDAVDGVENLFIVSGRSLQKGDRERMLKYAKGEYTYHDAVNDFMFAKGYKLVQKDA